MLDRSRWPNARPASAHLLVDGSHHIRAPPPRPFFLPLFGLSLRLQPMPTSSPNSAGPDLPRLDVAARKGELESYTLGHISHAPWGWDLDGDSRQSDQRFPPFSCPHVTYLISLLCPVPRPIPHPTSTRRRGLPAVEGMN